MDEPTGRAHPVPDRTPAEDPAGQDGLTGQEQEENESALGGLPRRVRQASLAPQLRDTATERAAEPRRAEAQQDTERDADEVRDRMASLQRGWQRGRRQNDAEENAGSGTQGTTSEGDGR
ncbi:hypothetical protein HY68_23040 [Streptomyces sp. AcH 505]|nr:hypothetical protein HY68_23040 [Streptomyces sp. AcH 505]